MNEQDDLTDDYINEIFGEIFNDPFYEFQRFMRRAMPYIPKITRAQMLKRPEKPRIYFNTQERPRTRSNP
jgi:hypothetical protein